MSSLEAKEQLPGHDRKGDQMPGEQDWGGHLSRRHSTGKDRGGELRWRPHWMEDGGLRSSVGRENRGQAVPRRRGWAVTASCRRWGPWATYEGHSLKGSRIADFFPWSG